MATTIGIKFYCKSEADLTVDIATAGAATGSSAIDVDANQINGVQNIPELQTAPSGIDVTSIEDYEEQSEPGLISGSALNITMNYKKALNTPSPAGDGSNFQQCLNLSDDNVHAFKIVLPNGRWFAVYGKLRTTVGAMAVASAMQFTITIYKKSKVATGYVAPTSTTPATPPADDNEQQ